MKSLQTKAANPYAAPPTIVDARPRGSVRVAVAIVLLFMTLFCAYWSVPPVFRALSFFMRSDFKMNLVRGIANISLIAATITCGIASASAWRGRWTKVLLVFVMATLLFLAGSLIVRFDFDLANLF